MFCCWWNDRTHIYEILSEGEVGELVLDQVVDIAHGIARIIEALAERIHRELTESNPVF